jgi:hypothetical protein
MTLNIYRNEVLAEILNLIDPNIFESHSDKALGVHIKNLIFSSVAQELNINYLSKIELKKIRGELSDRNNSSNEKNIAHSVIKAITNSDYLRAIDVILKDEDFKSLLKPHILKEFQSRIAKKKRGDALTRALEKMVKKNPNIKEPEVRELLRNGYSDDITYNHPEDGIYIESERKEIEITALKDRLSRVKKDLKKQIALAG